MNKIAKEQNEKKSIERLFVQRKIYSQAKTIFYVRLILALIIALIGPILAVSFPEQRHLIALLSLIYLLVEFFLKGVESNKKTIAAKIQELFDIEVFGLNWNDTIVGSKPSLEIINKYLIGVTEEDFIKSKIKNWYPVKIEELPQNLAILICQRSNIWWDSNLRKKVVICIYATLLFMSLFAIILNFTNVLSDVIINLLPLVPLYKVLIGQIIVNNKSITRLSMLKNKLEYILENNPSLININELRLIQDEMFRHRSSNQPIPNFFYKIFRNNSEKIMNMTAEQCIETYFYDKPNSKQKQ
jgi:hypothetical protein